MSEKKLNLRIKALIDARRDFAEAEGRGKTLSGGSRAWSTWKAGMVVERLDAADEISDDLREELETDVQTGKVKIAKSE